MSVYDKALSLGLGEGDQLEIFTRSNVPEGALLGKLRYFVSMDENQLTVGDELDWTGKSDEVQPLSWVKVFDIELRKKFNPAQYQTSTHK